jgi:DNA-directed RNA polymerase subunit K/omega
VSARDADLNVLEEMLGELSKEREAIRKLREQARGSKSSRGQAGGRRAAELRAEAWDEVRRDVADDPTLSALWERHRGKINPSKRTTRTEAFLQWVHDHPEAIGEMQAEQEQDYAREAEDLLGSIRGQRDAEELLSVLGTAEKFLRKTERLTPSRAGASW